MSNIGLVLEGGSMRGLFSSGVMDVFLENDITFKGGIGVSAGAAFGCNYKSKQKGRVIRYTTRFAKDPRFASIRSLIATGDIFNAEFGYETIPNKYDKFDYDAFAENPMEFYAVATDVNTGQAVYHKFTNGRGDDVQWFRASASVPVVSRPVEIKGRHFLDGGMSDSIPLRYFERKGYDKNVVVLTRPAEYRKEPVKVMPLVRWSLKEYPNIVRAIERRHKVYNKTLEYIREREKSGDIFIIRPPEELDIAPVCHDRDELRRVYNIGRKVMEENLEGLKEFLRNNE